MSNNVELSEDASKMCSGCFCRRKDGSCYWQWVDIQQQNIRAGKGHCGDAIHDQSEKDVHGSRDLVGGVWIFHPKPK